MTFLEKFAQDHPKAPMDADGNPAICPWTLGYEPHGDCADMCTECWSREMPKPKTILSELLRAFPNTELNTGGWPNFGCPYDLGVCKEGICSVFKGDCLACWQQEMPQEVPDV